MTAKAFLSWSSSDIRVATLAPILKSWLQDIFGGSIELFFSNDIEPGEASIPNVYRGLNEADLGFILLSQRTARSPWVIYEAGCLNPSLREGRVFPLLFDLTPGALRLACPPLADFQAASLRDPVSMRALVAKSARIAGMKDSDVQSVMNNFPASHAALNKYLRDQVDSKRLLPERFSGIILYGDSISTSHAFSMPAIFNNYLSELLLVGNNLTYLLNLANSTDNMEALLDSLLEDPSRMVRILVADLWDDRVLFTYDNAVLGTATAELQGLTPVLHDPDSPLYLDRFIRNYCSGPSYHQIRRQLTIKAVPFLGDTLWFIDADPIKLSGNMLFALMTAAVGRERPVFYVAQNEHPDLFSKHYDTCRAAFDVAGYRLWPRQ